VETVIGVFSSRDRAAEAVRELREQGVPQESLVFLSRSEAEARTVAKVIAAAVGGFVGTAASMSAGVVAAASVLLPEIGAVFILGFGAASMLGLSRPAGASGQAEDGAMAGSSDGQVSEDAAFFREVLKEGRSLIVVRTESQEMATKACEALDRLGIGMRGTTPVKMATSLRRVGEVVVLDVSGRITLGEGNVMLRQIIQDLAESGARRIVMNLGWVQYVDSSGLGELIRTHATIQGKGGALKLANLNAKVQELLNTTKLSSVFDIHKDVASAIRSFEGESRVEAIL
jgi:anti-sigma B factor antagonist